MSQYGISAIPTLSLQYINDVAIFSWGSLLACERQTSLLAHRRWGTFHEKERLRLIDRNSILMTQNLSGIRSDGPRSRFIVLAIVYKWQTKDKRPQRSNVNAMNLLQNSQYLWNIVFSKSSIWVLLQLIRRWTQHFTKIDQKTRKIGQIYIWNPMTTRCICKHWYV